VTPDAYPLLAGAGLAAAFIVFVLGYRMLRADATQTLAVEDLVLLRAAQRAEAQGMGPLERLAARLVPAVRRSLGPPRISRLQHRIDEAGRPDGMTVDVFLRRVVMWGLLCLPLALVLLLQGQLVGVLIALLIPLLIPFGKLSGAQRRRREALDRDLPDYLDVLAVTVTAGVAFRPALARVSERFTGPVADEIVLTLGQLGNGASVRQAFGALRERTSSEAMSQFVTAFLQSEELGAPLADTLNQIALDMRRDNAQRMRRKAAQAAPRVTLVTSLVLVPAALVLVIAAIIVGSRVDFGALLG
jgi:tight adherence protein C